MQKQKSSPTQTLPLSYNTQNAMGSRHNQTQSLRPVGLSLPSLPSATKNTALIQHLCKHISTLQQMNAQLHQNIMKIDLERDIICKALGKSSWHQLLKSVKLSLQTKHQTNKNNQMFLHDTTSTYRQQNTIFNQYSDTKTNNYSQQLQTPIKLKTYSQNKQTDKNYGIHHLSPPNFHFRQKHLNQENDYHFQSAFQSPIESQSRLINKSIRGATDRVDGQEMQIMDICDGEMFKKIGKAYDEEITLRNREQVTSKTQAMLHATEKAFGITNNHNLILNLNDLAFKSESKTDLNFREPLKPKSYNTHFQNAKAVQNGNIQKNIKNETEYEQENMILSVENTKLRGKINKLQALLASMQYQVQQKDRK